MSLKWVAKNWYYCLKCFALKHATRFSEIEHLYNACLPRSNNLFGAITLFDLAKKANGCIVELGAWAGNMTVVLAEGSGRGSKQPVYSIDDHGPFEVEGEYDYEDSRQDFEANVRKSYFGFLVRPVYKKSFEAVREWEKPIALLFIDTPHRRQLDDLAEWIGFVVLGGSVASRVELDCGGLDLMASFGSFFVYRKSRCVVWPGGEKPAKPRYSFEKKPLLSCIFNQSESIK